MSNPLYNAMNGNQGNNSLLQRFQQFRNSFRGDPRQQVQQMLNSGRISQAQYDQAVQQAKALQKMIGM